LKVLIQREERSAAYCLFSKTLKWCHIQGYASLVHVSKVKIEGQMWRSYCEFSIERLGNERWCQRN
jgi:hypothetical protein